MEEEGVREWQGGKEVAGQECQQPLTSRQQQRRRLNANAATAYMERTRPRLPPPLQTFVTTNLIALSMAQKAAEDVPTIGRTPNVRATPRGRRGMRRVIVTFWVERVGRALEEGVGECSCGGRATVVAWWGSYRPE